MSPHAVRLEELPSDASLTDLTKFSVTKNGFLPQNQPCQHLPDPYYEPWEIVAQHLPQLIETDGIRDAVSRMPVLSTDGLRMEAEWRRAYLLLAYMTHAYVWGGEKPEDVLPPQITKPFLRVSSHLELPPVLTYAAANLWNFSSSGTDFSKVEDLSTLVTFTGTESEAWFLLVSVAMEASAGAIIPRMMEALEAVKSRDYATITTALTELKACIRNLGDLLERMYERCDPMTFYHHIRPFLAGSKNMEDAGLPKGVFYDEGDGKGQWHQYRGGSNGQSSLIQFLDVILGVEHATHGSAGQKSFHHEVREYMPGPHRRFLVHVARAGSIRELALACGAEDGQISDSDEQIDEDAIKLRESFVAATEALTQLRNKHIQIVARYIVLPSKQPWDGGPAVRRRQNLASSSSKLNARGAEKEKEKELTGTGGTSLVSFLKQSRDETADAGNLSRARA